MNASEEFAVFVSYGRTEKGVADELVKVLESHQIVVLIDRRDLPYGEEWQSALEEFIRRADTVVWLVSPGSIRSQWCKWELSEVTRLNKRLVPLRIADVALDSIPEHLGRIQFLPAEGMFSIAEHEMTLLRVLSTDRSWLREHTRLAERARIWQDAGFPKRELLLHGRELKDAEDWIAAPLSIGQLLVPPPSPTDLHWTFLIASRAAEDSDVRERLMREQAARIAVGYQFSSRAQFAIEGQCFDRALRLALAGISLSHADTPGALFEDALDAARGSRLKLEVRPPSGLRAAALNKDQHRAAVMAKDGSLAVWDVTEARVLHTVSGPLTTDAPFRVAIDDEAARVLVGRGSDHIDVVNLGTGKTIALGPHAGRSGPMGLLAGGPLAYSTDEPKATGGTKPYVALHVWNVETGERVFTIDGFSTPIDTVLVHPSGTVLVTNGWSDECLSWNVASGRSFRDLSARNIRSVWCFSPDGRRYLTAHDGQTLQIRDWETDALLGSLTGHQQTITCACWSMDGAWLATGDGQGAIGLWDAVSGNRRHWILNNPADTASDSITAICFSKDGDGLLVAAEDAATITIWNLKERRRAFVCRGHESRINDIVVSVDGRCFYSVAPDEALRVWTLEDFPHSSAPTISLPHPSSAGLRPQRVTVPELVGVDPMFMDRAPGTRIFGRLRGRTALGPILDRGLGDAERFTDRERNEDALVRETLLNPFQALRDMNYQPPEEVGS